MNRVHAPGLLLVALASLTGVASLGAGTLSSLPGAGKPKRSFVITVEGGEDGPKQVTYDAESKRAPREDVKIPIPAPDQSGFVKPPEVGPVTSTKSAVDSAPRPTPARAPDNPSSIEKVSEMGEVDPKVRAYTKKEGDLSERRFGLESSDYFNRNDKYRDKDRVDYRRWDRSDENFSKESAPGVDLADRFSTEKVDKETITFSRKDRELFSGASDRADIAGWQDRFQGARNDRFTNGEKGSTLRERIANGYSMLNQVSMQDINKIAFRRNHSAEKGDLPVGRAGKGEAAPVGTMKKAGAE